MDGLKRSVNRPHLPTKETISWVAEGIKDQCEKWPESEACRPPRTCRCESEQKATFHKLPFPYTPVSIRPNYDVVRACPLCTTTTTAWILAFALHCFGGTRPWNAPQRPHASPPSLLTLSNCLRCTETTIFACCFAIDAPHAFPPTPPE